MISNSLNRKSSNPGVASSNRTGYSPSSCISEVGATLVEAALALPILFLVIFFTIDVARYFVVYINLSWAAQGAVDLMSKLPLELATDAEHCPAVDCPPGVATRADNCSRYARSLQQVESEGIARARLALEPVSGAVQLQSFSHFTPIDYPSDPSNPNKDNRICKFDSVIGMLRPGETIRRMGDNSAVHHPTKVSIGNEGWVEALANDPIAVVMEVRFTPLLPFIPVDRVKTVQVAYRTARKQINGSMVSVTPIPTLAPTVTSSPTPEATDTPGVVPTTGPTNTPTTQPFYTATSTPKATATPLPTVTPLPTETPTPFKSPTPSPTPIPKQCSSCSDRCQMQSRKGASKECACCCLSAGFPSFYNKCIGETEF